MRNDRRDDDLFDEMRLRRALRLEAAEFPPRIDVAAIAARAGADQPAFAVASLISTLFAAFVPGPATHHSGRGHRRIGGRDRLRIRATKGACR